MSYEFKQNLGMVVVLTFPIILFMLFLGLALLCDLGSRHKQKMPENKCDANRPEQCERSKP